MPVRIPGILKFTGWREPISISGAGKVVDGILRRRPCFFGSSFACRRRGVPAGWTFSHRPVLRGAFGVATPQMRGVARSTIAAKLSGSAYPVRSRLRYGGLDICCSISQNIQTMAAPKQVTIIRNSNVSAGAVSMFNILDQRQTAYHRTELNPDLAIKTPRSYGSYRRDSALEVLDAFASVRSSQIPAQSRTSSRKWLGRYLAAFRPAAMADQPRTCTG